MTKRATVQKIEGERVTLVFEDGQELKVLTSTFEGTPKVGSTVAVVFAALGAEDAGRTGLARELLNEILLT